MVWVWAFVICRLQFYLKSKAAIFAKEEEAGGGGGGELPVSLFIHIAVACTRAK